jgi:hypothetical protein
MELPIFKQLLSKIKKTDDTIDVLYKYINITTITEEYNAIIALLLEHYYGEDANEWIGWYLYEKNGDKDMKAFDKYGKEICRNEKELWKLCEEARAVKLDYKEKILMTDTEKEAMFESMIKNMAN